jgi:RNA polymerase sigma-70 factor (ECF subfamily)
MRDEEGIAHVMASGCASPSPAHVDQRSQTFDSFYRVSYPFLVKCCRRWLRGAGDPEAIAQEALARAWATPDRFAGTRFRGWVFTIARHLCIDAHRRAAIERTHADTAGHALEPTATPMDETVQRKTDQRLVLDVLRNVPAGHRRMMVLRYLDGWSYQEIATAEGITVNAVRARLNRARASFRRAYDKTTSAGRGYVVVRWNRLLRTRLGGRSSGSDLAPWLLQLGSGNDMLIAFASILLAAAPAIAIVPTGTSAGPAALATVTRGENSTGATPKNTEATPVSPITKTTAPVLRPTSTASRPPTADVASTIVPVGGDTEEAEFHEFTPSPTYDSDGTVFGTGYGLCGSACPNVFRSEDRGRSWQRLPALGYAGGPIVLPPDYPLDARIFAVTFTGTLQVSYDAGTSFTPVPGFTSGNRSEGYPVMSPDFRNDGRILVGPDLEYSEKLGAVVMARTSRANSTVVPHFSPAYATDRTMFLASSRAVAHGWQGEVHRCVNGTCRATVFPEARAHPMVALSSPFSDRSVVLIAEGDTMYRSVDGGQTYDRLVVPLAGRVTSLFVDSRERLLVAVQGLAKVGRQTVLRGGLALSTDHGRSWRIVSEGTPLLQGASVVRALPDGRIVIGRYSHSGGGLWCSVDDGATWHGRCPA